MWADGFNRSKYNPNPTITLYAKSLHYGKICCKQHFMMTLRMHSWATSYTMSYICGSNLVLFVLQIIMRLVEERCAVTFLSDQI